MCTRKCVPDKEISYSVWIKQFDDTLQKYDKKTFSISDERHQKIIEGRNHLKRTFLKKQMSLFIGSGITANYIGTWFSLLGKLFCERFIDRSTTRPVSKEQQDFINRITVDPKSGISPTELGQYLLLDSKDESSDIFDPSHEAQWRELYLAAQIQSHMPDINAAISNAIKSCNPQECTFDALLTLCCCIIRNDFSFKHIVNYNYDTLIERCLSDMHYREALRKANPGRRLCFSPQIEVIEHEDVKYSMFPDKRTFQGYEDSWRNRRQYHVHGCLEHDGLPRRVVFSESSYDDLNRELYRWCNQVQAEIALRFPALFVGFSGNDPNFRRLLKAITNGNSRPESFLFMRLSDVREVLLLSDQKPDARDIKKEKQSQWLAEAVETLLESVEYYYKKTFNINILWYQNYYEIAQTLLMLADQCDS